MIECACIGEQGRCAARESARLRSGWVVAVLGLPVLVHLGDAAKAVETTHTLGAVGALEGAEEGARGDEEAPVAQHLRERAHM